MHTVLILETAIGLIVFVVSGSGSVNVNVVLEDTAFYRIKSVGTYFLLALKSAGLHYHSWCLKSQL